MIRLFSFVILFFIITSTFSCFALTQNEMFLNSAEKKLFCVTYQNEPSQKRLSRLEKNIFGIEKKNLSEDLRINALKKASVFSPPISTPKPVISKAPQTEINLPPQKDIGSYPAIDRLETTVLKKNYKNEDIYPRLERLENAVYKKTYSQKDLAWRTDNLNSSVFKEEPLKEASSYGSDEQKLSFVISELEKNVLNQSYPQENPTNRIRRLERSIYNSTYEEDSTYLRLERIIATVEAIQRPRTYEYAYPNLYNGLGSSAFGYRNPYHTVNNTTGTYSASQNDFFPFLLFMLLGFLI